MKARSFFGQNAFSYPIVSLPMIAIAVGTILGYIPYWLTATYLASLGASALYLKYIRIPHLQRVALCITYFGTVRCTHGKYLPDEICESCADAFLAKQEQNFLSAIQQQVNLPGPKETVH